MNGKLDTKGTVIIVAQVVLYATGVLCLVLGIPVLSVALFALSGIISLTGIFFAKPAAGTEDVRYKMETFAPAGSDSGLKSLNEKQDTAELTGNEGLQDGKLLEELEELKAENQRLKDANGWLEQGHAKLKEDYESLREQLDIISRKPETTEQCEPSAGPQAEALAAENDRLREESAKLKSENAELNRGVLSLRETNDELNSKLKTLRSELLKKSEYDKDAMVASGAEFGEGQGVVLNRTPVVRTVLFDEKLLNDRSNIDICLTANDTIEEMRPFANRAGIRMTVISSGGPVVFRSSGKLMKTLMRNIVDNSIKYMKRAGNIFITITDTGDDVFIVCKDDGMGIDAEELGFIFDLNFQGSNRVSGNGLGLTQARDIVNAYGGTIYAKSSPGTGMGIYIQLPKNGFGGAL